MAKELIVFPEVHIKSRRSEAVGFAKETARMQAKVRLFLEGTIAGQSVKRSEEVGFPVTGIEHDKLHPVIGRLSSACGLLQCNAYIYAIFHPDDSASKSYISSIMAELKKVAQMTATYRQGELPEFECITPQNALKYLMRSVGYNVELGLEHGFITADGMKLAFKDIAANGRNSIASTTKQYLELAMMQMEDGFFREMAQILSDTQQMIRTHGCDIGLEDSNLTPQIIELLAIQNPLELNQAMNELNGELSVYRNMFMALCIYNSDFQIGVLNVGANHAHPDSLLSKVLGMSGLQMTVK